MIKIGLKIAAIAIIGHWLVAGLARGDEFTEALNAQRSARGLAPVAESAGLQSTAARNNAVQAVYGLGHFVLEGFGQCAAIGQPSCRSVLDSWLISGPHAAILLDPRIVAVGYAQLGVAHTVPVSWVPIIEASPPGAPLAAGKGLQANPSLGQGALASVTIDKATGKVAESTQAKPGAPADKLGSAHQVGTTGSSAPACPTASPVAMTALPIKTIGPRGSCRGGWHPFRRRRVVMFQ